jgi:nitroreductase
VTGDHGTPDCLTTWSAMEMRDVMRSTPATRQFAPEAVPDQVLHDILDVARFAPSGGNRQPWHVIVVKDLSTRRALRDLYAIGWREYTAHTRRGEVPFAASGRGALTADELVEARRTPAPGDFVDHLDELPVMLVVTADLDRLATTDRDLDRLTIVPGASVYAFVHNVLLAARDLGYGGVMTTVLCRQEPAVKELLNLPDHVAVASLVALGRPATTITHLRRAPVDEFVTVDRYDGVSFAP